MEIVTVHYKTPDLLERLINSIRAFSEIKIRVIDGSDTEESQRLTKIVCGKPNVILEMHGYNIHHGRGLHHAISTSTEDWCLCVDSEVQLKQGILEALTYSKPLEGFACKVDSNGINNPIGGITYLHPELLLVNVNWYNNQQFKFIHHGAPAIRIMAGTSNDEKYCMDENYRELYIRGGRGTVSRFGYNF